MRRNEILPIIFGMNPPSKEVIIRKGKPNWGGYDLFILHTEFNEGVESGAMVTNEDVKKRFGIAAQLHFRDLDSMKKFGEMIVEAERKFEHDTPSKD